MAFNLGGFGAAGGGADALEQLLQRAFAEQIARKRASQEDQRIKIDQQRANSDDELRRIALQDRQTAADEQSQVRKQTGALKMMGQLRPKDVVTPEQSATITAGGFGDKLVAPTLASRNIGQGMASTPNPGRGESFAGLPDQLDEQKSRDDFDRMATMAEDPKIRGALRMIGTTTPDVNKRGPLVAELMKEQAKPAPKSAALQEFEDVQNTPGLAAYQTEDANRKRTNINIGGGGLTPTAEANLTAKLAGDWQKVSAPAREMDRQFNLMQTGLKRFHEGDKNGGAQAVLVTFQKILDPTSVVRESEYARSAQGVSLLQRMQGYAERLKSGGAGVPEAALQEMVNTAQQFTANSRNTAEGQRKRLGAFADKYKIPHELVFDDSGGAAAPATGKADLVWDGTKFVKGGD